MIVRYNAKNDPHKRAPYTDGKEYNAADYIPGHYEGEYYVEGYYLLMENDNRVFAQPTPINEFLFDHINDGFKCVCCGAITPVDSDNCDGWHEDSVQATDPDYSGGANWLSLNQAKENWKKYGVLMTEKDIQERKEFYRAHIAPDGTWIHDK